MANARRKTTKEERKEIAEYCIAHNKDYNAPSLLNKKVGKVIGEDFS